MAGRQRRTKEDFTEGREDRESLQDSEHGAGPAMHLRLSSFVNFVTFCALIAELRHPEARVQFISRGRKATQNERGVSQKVTKIANPNGVVAVGVVGLCRAMLCAPERGALLRVFGLRVGQG